MRLWGLWPSSRPQDSSGDGRCSRAHACWLLRLCPWGPTSRLRVYRIRVKRLSTDTDSWERDGSDGLCARALCEPRVQQQVGKHGHTTQLCYLCRAGFAEDIPEPQGLISSSSDDGLPIRGHGL